MGRLEGKVAIVTGAARGTGAEIARLFDGEGARTTLVDVLDGAGSAGVYVDLPDHLYTGSTS